MNNTELLQSMQARIDAMQEVLVGMEARIEGLIADAASRPVAEAAAASDGNMGLTLFVFALAIFLGVELITKVPSQLHTPLMSGSNAISGITIVGALIALKNVPADSPMVILLGTLAVITATVNVVGGYLVTDRMLGMFKSKKEG
jgi:NAD(P) transhydrogenase subunit alpha